MRTLRTQSDPDADRSVDGRSRDSQRSREHGQNGLGVRGCGVSSCDFTERDDELVPTETRHEAVRSHEHLELPSDFHQELVTGIVPARIVDDLEVVEIQQHESDPAVGATGLQRLLQIRTQQEPVGQPRHWVVVGQMIEATLVAQQFQLDMLAFRDIVGDVTKRLSPIDLELAHRHLDIEQLPVLASLLDLTGAGTCVGQTSEGCGVGADRRFDQDVLDLESDDLIRTPSLRRKE